MEISNNDCLQYKEITDSKGDSRYIVLDELSCHVSDLTPDLPYEFRIAAVNEVGEGVWSESSRPIVMPNPDKAPKMPELVNLKTMQEVIELRENLKMINVDWNANREVRNDSLHAFTSQTPRSAVGDKKDNEIPRYRILPVSSNPREGWNENIYGGQNQEILALMGKDHIIRRSVFRDHAGFAASVSDTALGKYARIEFQEEKEEEGDKFKNVICVEARPQDGGVTTVSMMPLADYDATIAGVPEDGDDDDEKEETFELKKEELKVEAVIESSALNHASVASSHSRGRKFALEHKSPLRSFKSSVSLARDWNDDAVMDGKEVLRSVGRPNKRQVHYLGLRSAYESCTAGGEPVFTCSRPSELVNALEVECKDYIFYSAANFVSVRVLSMPSITQLKGNNPKEPMLCDDLYQLEPSLGLSPLFNTHINGSSDVFNDNDANKGPVPRTKVIEMKKALAQVLAKSKLAGPVVPNDEKEKGGGCLWGGVYCPAAAKNPYKMHSWLPNDTFCSSHLALCAEFSFIER